MNVFISWSKEPSRSVARALSNWLPSVINAIDPWMLEEDIQAVSRWNNQISAQLANTKFGIICVTPQNQHEPWLQFESGALAKAVNKASGSTPISIGESYVCPYLVEIKAPSLTGPLTAFQSVEADRNGTLNLLKSINKAVASAGEKSLDTTRLENVFGRLWGGLEITLNSLPKGVDAKPTRKESEILAEVLETVRDTNRKVQDLDFYNFTNRLAAKLPYPISKLTPAIRTVTLEGRKENLYAAVSDIQRRQEHLDESISFSFTTPREVDILLVSESFSTFEDITTFMAMVAAEHNVTAKF